MAPLGEGVPTPNIFFSPMTLNFSEIGENNIFGQKNFWGRVPPAHTPKITTPSNFPYTHFLFTMTLLRSSGDV